MRALHAAAIVALAQVAGAALARPARADERPLAEALVVEAADPCLEPARLAERLAEWLGRDALDERLMVLVLPTARGADFALHRDGDRTAVRRFPVLPTDCAERIDALTLAMALALDATLLEALAAAEAPTVEASRPRAPPAGTPAPPPAPPPRPSHEGGGPAFAVSAGVEGHAGIGPEPWLNVELDVELAWPRVGVEAGIVASPEREVALATGAATLASLGGRAALCFRQPFERIASFRACGTVSAGVLRGVGRGFAEVGQTDLAWLRVGARAALRVRPVDALLLGLYLEPRIAVVRPELFAEAPDGSRLGATGGEVVGAALGVQVGGWFE